MRTPPQWSLVVLAFVVLLLPARTPGQDEDNTPPVFIPAQDEVDTPPASTVPPRPPSTAVHVPAPEEDMHLGEPAPATTTDDVRVSAPNEALAEVVIDVNPTNPHNMVICGHSPSLSYIATWYSFDAGTTWTPVPVGSAQDGFGYEFRFDPALAFDADGNVYVAYGVTYGPAHSEATTVIVCKSTDGGKTYTQCAHVWDALEVAGVEGNDKWALATGPDPAVPGRQNVYIAWTWNVPASNNVDQQIVFSRSIDGGVTFSPPVVINDKSIAGRDRALDADPAVGPDGELYVSWNQFDTARLLVDRSFDGGVTWGTDVVVSTQAMGFETKIPAQPDRGVSAGPITDVDVSSGPHRGRAYMTYCQPTGSGLDILLRHSDDHGAHWSAPVRVNDDATTRDQFLPCLDVGRNDGAVSVAFYDAREDPLNQSVRVYAGISRDGGETFEPNRAVSDVPSNNSVTNRYRYLGNYLEYIGVAIGDCAAYVVWTDIRDQPRIAGTGYYYFDRVRFDTSPPELTCPDGLTVECNGDGGLLITDPRWTAFVERVAVTDNCDPHCFIGWVADFNALYNGGLFPVGDYVIQFTAIDNAGNFSRCQTYLTVLDSSPPELKVTLTPGLLWPPDHRMVDVHADVSLRDDCALPENLHWVLWSVTSNQPADGTGDGSASPDIEDAVAFSQDTDFRLRAERTGEGEDRRYQVVYAGSDGNYEVYDTVYVTVPHDMRANGPPVVEDRLAAPVVTALHDARPNPFNPATTIAFDLAAPTQVDMLITDVNGARVRTLLREQRPAGAHGVQWNGCDDRGRPVASGVYFVRMQAGGYSAVRKLVLLK